MARRSAPPHSGPSYLPPTAHSEGLHHVDPDETWIKRFFREEVFSPERIPSNIQLLVNVTVFLGGIAAIRNWGESIVGQI